MVLDAAGVGTGDAEADGLVSMSSGDSGPHAASTQTSDAMAAPVASHLVRPGAALTGLPIRRADNPSIGRARQSARNVGARASPRRRSHLAVRPRDPTRVVRAKHPTDQARDGAARDVGACPADRTGVPDAELLARPQR